MYKIIKLSIFIVLFAFLSADVVANTVGNDYEPDVNRKYKECVDLVNRAEKHLKTSGLKKSLNDFLHNPLWRKGEIYIFVFDGQGVILCEAENPSLIWQHITLTENLIGQNFFDNVKDTSSKGSWVHYKWNNAPKAAYIKQVDYNNKAYYVGAGFFPQTKQYIAEQLVESAVLYFNQVSPDLAYTRINDPKGSFVMGEIGTYIGDFEGNILADGIDYARIGQNIAKFKDSKGNLILENIIKTITNPLHKGILDLDMQGNIQRNYLKELPNKTGKKMFCGASFFPNVTSDDALLLIEKAIAHIKKVGNAQAFIDFLNPRGPFKQNRLNIFVYDLHGNNLADGEYPSLMDHNLIDRRDSDGKFIVKEMLSSVKTSSKGSLVSYEKGAFREMFFELVDTNDGKIIVGSSIYQSSKKYSVKEMVERAVRFLETNTLADSLAEFTSGKMQFCFGDVLLFVCTLDGKILINGFHNNQIWQKYTLEQDQSIIEKILKKAQSGGGWVEYSINNATFRAYIALGKVKMGKSQKEFIICSGYYL